MRKTISTAAIAAMVLTATASLAAPTPEEKCEVGKNDAAGKYAASIAKAEKGFISSGDAAKHGLDFVRG